LKKNNKYLQNRINNNALTSLPVSDFSFTLSKENSFHFLSSKALLQI